MKKLMFFAFMALMLMAMTTQPQPLTQQCGAKAEYLPARRILMHQPGKELFLGVVHPGAALFEDYFDIALARKEHEEYQKKLRDIGAEVLIIEEVLLRGTDKEGDELKNLREFAKKFLFYNTTNISGRVEQEQYKDDIINKATPHDLVRIILMQPEIVLRRTENNTKWEADYIQHPVTNLFFTRDQIITTAKGVVIGRMNSTQRQDECFIVEFCLKKLGIKPLGRISDDGRLEGGDFLTFGETAFIGCGMRTNMEAINQLMKKDWLGVDTLVVVKDSLWSQDQMHLDTHFNIIDKKLVTMSQDRLKAEPHSKEFLKVDVYIKQNDGSYEKDDSLSGKSFKEYLERLEITIIPIKRTDDKNNENYACNYLTVAPDTIMAVAGQSSEFYEVMRLNNVEVINVDVRNLIKGYGAAHCMTQVLVR